MAWTPAQPMPTAGLTARVSNDGDGVRVELRHRGFGRFVIAGFLLIWIVGWAVGEFFVLGTLLAMAGVPFGLGPMSSPRTSEGGLGAAAFLVVWLTFWTLGGLAALRELLRLFWGADVFTLGPAGWALHRQVGPFRQTFSFNRGEVRRLGLRVRDAALIAEIGSRAMVLTTLGSEEDRAWLRDLLRAASGPEATPCPGAAAATPLPEGYTAEPGPEGTVRVAVAASERAKGVGCVLVLALLWNGILGCSVCSSFLRADVGALPGAGFWIGLSPMILIGLFLLFGVAWCARAVEEWRVRRDYLEDRLTFLGYGRIRHYTGGELTVTVTTDSDGDQCWKLVLRTAGKERVLRRGEPAELRALGAFLAARTGWRLTYIDHLV